VIADRLGLARLHLRRLHFMWRLSRSSEPGGIAV
jgi:hypothetical protein